MHVVVKASTSNQTNRTISIIVVSSLFVLFTILILQQITVTLHIPNAYADESYHVPVNQQTLVLFSIFWPMPNHLHGKRDIKKMVTRIAKHCDSLLKSNHANVLLRIKKVKWIWIGNVSLLLRNVPQCFASNISKLEDNLLTVNLPYNALPYLNQSNVVDANCSTKFGGKLGDNALRWLNRIWLSKVSIVLNVIKQNATVKQLIHSQNTLITIMDAGLKNSVRSVYLGQMEHVQQMKFDTHYIYAVRYTRSSKRKRQIWFGSGYCTLKPRYKASVFVLNYETALSFDEQFRVQLNKVVDVVMNKPYTCKCFDEEMVIAHMMQSTNYNSYDFQFKPLPKLK
eukprot:310902_1